MYLYMKFKWFWTSAYIWMDYHRIIVVYQLCRYTSLIWHLVFLVVEQKYYFWMNITKLLSWKTHPKVWIQTKWQKSRSVEIFKPRFSIYGIDYGHLVCLDWESEVGSLNKLNIPDFYFGTIRNQCLKERLNVWCILYACLSITIENSETKIVHFSMTGQLCVVISKEFST